MYSPLFVTLMGIGTVFFGLICIIVLTTVMGSVLKSNAKPAPAPAAAPKAAAPAAPAPAPKPVLAAAAPGSAGEVKLFNVPDKDAAMLMAIVANKLNKPLNELRFKSIKEVK